MNNLLIAVAKLTKKFGKKSKFAYLSIKKKYERQISPFSLFILTAIGFVAVEAMLQRSTRMKKLSKK